jgi:hypothetical protein
MDFIIGLIVGAVVYHFFGAKIVAAVVNFKDKAAAKITARFTTAVPTKDEDK